MGVASPPADADEVIVFLDSEGFDALAPGSAWEADAEGFRLCAARCGERVALHLKPEPSPSALVLMDEEVRALVAGGHLVVGEAAAERGGARLDRAAAVPLPASLVRGVVNAVDLL